MSAVVIDLISSSPVPGSPTPRCPSQAPSERLTGANEPRERVSELDRPRTTVAAKIQIASRVAPFSILISDDEDDLDAARGNDSYSSQAKRRKLSTSRSPSDLRSTVNPPGPRNNAATSPGPRGSFLQDSLELLSSSPAAMVSTRLLSDGSDPFASPFPYTTARKTDSPAARVEKDLSFLGRGCAPKGSSLEDILSDPFGTSPELKSPPQRRDASNWDPITTSTPDHLRHRTLGSPCDATRRRPAAIDIIHVLDSASVSTDDSFPDLEDLDPAQCRRAAETALVASKKPTRAPKTSKSSTKPIRSTQLEREKKAAMREAEKERKRLAKQKERELKAEEKDRANALAEVNKIKTDKKLSTKEMIAFLPSSFSSALRVQVETLLDSVGAQHQPWASPLSNVVKWKRRTCSSYNEDMGHWEPVPTRVEDESFALRVLSADEFVALALAAEGKSLDDSTEEMERGFPGHTLIFVIEGLNAWMRKNRNVRNRQFATAVRSQGADNSDEPPSSSQQTRRQKKAPQPSTYVSEEAVEDALLALQVNHDTLIFHTAAPVETAQWICTFTQHISTVRYRRQEQDLSFRAGAGFCMDAGQVRSGDDKRDTYVRMLQEIGRITAPIAFGIAEEFGTVSDLVRGLTDGGAGRLADVRKCVSDGVVGERTVGAAVSKRVWKVFTGLDEESTDI